MRIVFMGTPDFAVPSLRSLAGRHDVVSVFTRPDAVSGRGNSTVPSPVKATALELGLEVVCTKGFSDPAVVERLAALSPELIVVVAFGAILPDHVLALPALGCINVHASLLPRWRGAAPIQRAILAGDESAGVSIMKIAHDLDSGDVCANASTPIDGRNALDLTGALAEMGAELLIDSIEAITVGRAVWVPQDETRVTYADKINKAELRLSPEDGAVPNLLRVRAAAANATARCRICGRSLTVTEAASVSQPACAMGEVAFSEDAVMLGCADGDLAVTRVKPDGKSEMPVRSWISGLHDVPMSWEALT